MKRGPFYYKLNLSPFGSRLTRTFLPTPNEFEVTGLHRTSSAFNTTYNLLICYKY